MSELEKIKSAEIVPGKKSYLFYGPGGTGKTTLALQHPGKRKLVIDADNKLHEMENCAPYLNGVDVWTSGEMLTPGGITMVVVDPKRKDAATGFNPSAPAPRGFQKQVDLTNDLIRMESKLPYDVVIWDSGTSSVDHLIQAILHQHRMGTMTETLWGVFATNFNNYLEGFLRLPCERIVVFHDRHVTKRDRDGNIVEEFTRPSVYGQSGINMNRKFSECYYFLGRNFEGKYAIQTQSDSILPARTTKGLDFKQVIDPKRIYGE